MVDTYALSIAIYLIIKNTFIKFVLQQAEIASWADNDDFDDEEEEDKSYDDWEEVKDNDDNTPYFYSCDKPFGRNFYNGGIEAKFF